MVSLQGRISEPVTSEAQGRPAGRFPLLSAAPLDRPRCLLVGCSPPKVFCSRIAKFRKAVITGWIGPEASRDSQATSGMPWLGETGALEEIVLDFCIDEVHLLSGPGLNEEEIPFIVAKAREMGIPVCIHERLDPTGFAEVRHDGQQKISKWLVPLSRRNSVGLIAKRACDIAISGLLLLLLAPIFLGIMVAIRLDSPGTLFFRQPRVGLGRRQFLMWKFRTMVPNAEQLRSAVEKMNGAKGISFKIYGDPRVTRVGAQLRRWSLDELPQLINVLVGQMSLVGPRPIPVWVAERLGRTRHYRRFSVNSGISGWWQVNGRTQDFDAMADKDLEYIDLWNFWLDCRIIAATPLAIVRGENAV